MRAALALFLLVACVQAGETPRATLSGRVLDPSGALIPEAVVRAMSNGQRIAEAASDHEGAFRMTLPAGTYSVEAEAIGFRPFRREGVVLSQGAPVEIDIGLELESLSVQTTITAKAPPMESALETRTRNFEEKLEIREVRESSSKDVGEALSRIDGFWKVRKGGVANDVVLRGFQQGNLDVLIDGARIHGACPNNMDPAAFHVDFAEVQEVQVVKGAFDMRNQGALGGVVSIVNKAPAPGLHITPSFSAGSFGYINPSIVGSIKRGRFYLLGGNSYRRSDPYKDGSGKSFTSYANYRPGAQNSRAFDVDTAWGRFGYTLTEGQRVEAGYTRQNSGKTLYPYLQMDAGYDNADRANAKYVWSNVSNAIRQIRVESYFSKVRHWMTDEQRLTSAGLARPYSMATFAGTRSLGGRVEAELTDFVAGYEVYRRGWTAVNTMRMMGVYKDQSAIPDVALTVGGAYADYRRTFFRRLLVSAGARLDTAKTAALSSTLNTDLFWAYKNTRTSSATDTNPSGKVWLMYSLPAGLELFSGIGHTVRLPDPRERFFMLRRSGSDWVGNPNLEPTQNTEADIGLSYRNRRFSLKPTLYYSKLANFITVQNQALVNTVPGITNTMARSYENVSARMYGGELGYSVGITQALLLSGGLSYSRGTKDAKPQFRIFDTNLAEMPPMKSRAGLRYGTRHFFVEVESLAAWAQRRVDTDLRELPTPGYMLMNVKFGIHTNKLNVAAGADNLSNRFYYEAFSYQRDPFRTGVKVPEPGRSLYVTSSFAF